MVLVGICGRIFLEVLSLHRRAQSFEWAVDVSGSRRHVLRAAVDRFPAYDTLSGADSSLKPLTDGVCQVRGPLHPFRGCLETNQYGLLP